MVVYALKSLIMFFRPSIVEFICTIVSSSADPALREAVTGISPPEAEKHELYIDVQPMMGTAMKARARVQINLAVSQVRDIKQVATFPDIVFPIMWFEDVSIYTSHLLQ